MSNKPSRRKAKLYYSKLGRSMKRSMTKACRRFKRKPRKKRIELAKSIGVRERDIRRCRGYIAVMLQASKFKRYYDIVTTTEPIVAKKIRRNKVKLTYLQESKTEIMGGKTLLVDKYYYTYIMTKRRRRWYLENFKFKAGKSERIELKKEKTDEAPAEKKNTTTDSKEPAATEKTVK